MGTSTTDSSDPRRPVQRRGNVLVFFVVLALAGAAIYGYFYVNLTQEVEPAVESPVNAATPVTQE
jgi:hypothetical protein